MVWPFKLKPIERGPFIQRRKYRREHTVVVDEVHRPAIGVGSYGRVTRRDPFQKRFRMMSMWLDTIIGKDRSFPPGSLPSSPQRLTEGLTLGLGFCTHMCDGIY